MTDPQPQYAPGDPVLVAAKVVEGPDWEGDCTVAVVFGQTEDRGVYVRAADVHPVPPTPDPRDITIAAVRALHAELKVYPTDLDGELDLDHPWASICAGCSHEDDLSALEDNELDQGAGASWPCPTWEALDGVAPVPAPPAPTPTGWTAEREGDRFVAYNQHGARGRSVLAEVAEEDGVLESWIAQAESRLDHEVGPWRAVLALRAEEAAASAPATTEDAGPLETSASWGGPHLVAGSLRPAHSDLGGLAAREAGA